MALLVFNTKISCFYKNFLIIIYELLCLVMINHKCNNCALNWLQVRNLDKKQKKPRKTEEEVTEELVRLMIQYDSISNVGVNTNVEKVIKYDELVSTMKKNERLTKMQKQNIFVWCIDKDVYSKN